MNLVLRPLVVEEILAPGWKFLIAFIEITAVIAEGTWAFGSVADSPDSGSPDPAVCAAPRLSLTVFVVSFDVSIHMIP